MSNLVPRHGSDILRPILFPGLHEESMITVKRVRLFLGGFQPCFCRLENVRRIPVRDIPGQLK